MKYATWTEEGRELAGVLGADGHSLHSFAACGLPCQSLQNFIETHTAADVVRLEEARLAPGVPLEKVRLMAPLPRPGVVFCLGLNYMDHAKESANFDVQGDPARAEAVYFAKYAHRALGTAEAIPSHAGLVEELDYEAELAVVIGKTARHVAREEALAHVFGLMCLNDVTSRDLQKKHNQWFVGKSLDGFTVCGPFLTSLDEFRLPLELTVEARVNGEVRQRNNTKNMIFPIAYAISQLSAGITLAPGAILSTGTPAGVGAGFRPPRFLRLGDVCEVEIEGCGVLRNTVE